MSISDRDKLLVAIALTVGAYLQHYDDGVILESEAGTAFATRLLINIVDDPANQSKTPKEISLHILRVWKASQ